MHGDDTPPPHRPLLEDDDIAQRAVLHEVLDFLPSQLSIEELVRRIAADPECFAERDAVQRAVRDLISVGLLRQSGEVVSATLGVQRADVLLGQSE